MYVSYRCNGGMEEDSIHTWGERCVRMCECVCVCVYLCVCACVRVQVHGEGVLVHDAGIEEAGAK